MFSIPICQKLLTFYIFSNFLNNSEYLLTTSTTSVIAPRIIRYKFRNMIRAAFRCAADAFDSIQRDIAVPFRFLNFSPLTNQKGYVKITEVSDS